MTDTADQLKRVMQERRQAKVRTQLLEIIRLCERYGTHVPAEQVAERAQQALQEGGWQ
jgi:ribosome recycling factor